MGSIGYYVFRTTLSAFLVVIVTLTALIWVTQALRDLELMTSQGQSALVFLEITALIIPNLVLLLSPLAFAISVGHVLNKLATDSEIIVINASGMSPWRLFQPFLASAAVISVLVALLSAYLAPESLRAFRRWVTEVRTDLVTYALRPGRFITVQEGVTFHIRERLPNDELRGVLIDDKRDEDQGVTILAERGDILKNDSGTFLVLDKGSIQQHKKGEVAPTIVVFDRYAFDLSQFAGPVSINYSVRERYIWQLIWPQPLSKFADADAGHLRAELYDRIMAPLYPLVFVLIAFTYLGAPRTTRQSRNMSLVGATFAVLLLRFLGFAAAVIGVNSPAFIVFEYLVVAATVGVGIWAIGRGIVIEPPAFVSDTVAALVKRFAPPAEPA
ncbi:MAG TPA: LPS export ABC transporter permease LptF [Xanthobacteraceae bacterium]|nr:LPS export ABC transporter permease LptF [Xanthobacteraceae bacterium]